MLKKILCISLAMAFFVQNLSWAMASTLGYSNPLALEIVKSKLPVVENLTIRNHFIYFGWKQEKSINKFLFLKAFFTALQLQDKYFWVNLGLFKSLDEICSPALNNTIIGDIFLKSDLILKREAMKWLAQNGTISDKLVKFRLWIVPEKVVIKTNPNKSSVQLKEIYLKVNVETASASKLPLYLKKLAKALTYKVNHNKAFEDLRNLFRTIALAKWYKIHAKSFWPYYQFINKDLLNSSLIDSNYNKKEILMQFGKLVFKSALVSSNIMGGGIIGNIPKSAFKEQINPIGPSNPNIIINRLRDIQNKLGEAAKRFSKKMFAVMLASTIALNPLSSSIGHNKSIQNMPPTKTLISKTYNSKLTVPKTILTENIELSSSSETTDKELTEEIICDIWGAYLDHTSIKLTQEEKKFLEKHLMPKVLYIITTQGAQNLSVPLMKLVAGLLFAMPKGSKLVKKLVKALESRPINLTWVTLGYITFPLNYKVDGLPYFPLPTQLAFSALGRRYILYGEQDVKVLINKSINNLMNILEKIKLPDRIDKASINDLISIFNSSKILIFLDEWLTSTSIEHLSDIQKQRRTYLYKKMAKLASICAQKFFPLSQGITTNTKGHPTLARQIYLTFLSALNKKLAKEKKSIPVSWITGIYSTVYAKFLLGDIALKLAESLVFYDMNNSKKDRRILEAVVLDVHPKKVMNLYYSLGETIFKSILTIDKTHLNATVILTDIILSFSQRDPAYFMYNSIKNLKWTRKNAWILAPLALLSIDGYSLKTIIHKLKKAKLQKGEIFSTKFFPFWLAVMDRNKLEKALLLLKKEHLIVDTNDFASFAYNIQHNRNLAMYFKGFLYLLKQQSGKTDLIHSLKVSIGSDLDPILRTALFGGKINPSDDTLINKLFKILQDKNLSSSATLSISWDTPSDMDFENACEWLRDNGFIMMSLDSRTWLKKLGKTNIIVNLAYGILNEDTEYDLLTNVILWSSNSFFYQYELLVSLGEVNSSTVDRILSYNSYILASTIDFGIILGNNPYSKLKFLSRDYSALFAFTGVNGPKEVIELIEIFSRTILESRNVQEFFSIMRKRLDAKGLKHIKLPNEGEALFFTTPSDWKHISPDTKLNGEKPTFRYITTNLLIFLPILLTLTLLPSISFAAKLQTISHSSYLTSSYMALGLILSLIGVVWSIFNKTKGWNKTDDSKEAREILSVFKNCIEPLNDLLTDSESNLLANWLKEAHAIFPNDNIAQASYLTWQLENHPQFYPLFLTVLEGAVENKTEIKKLKEKVSLFSNKFLHNKKWQKQVKKTFSSSKNNKNKNILKPGGIDLRTLTLEPV